MLFFTRPSCVLVAAMALRVLTAQAGLPNVEDMSARILGKRVKYPHNPPVVAPMTVPLTAQSPQSVLVPVMTTLVITPFTLAKQTTSITTSKTTSLTTKQTSKSASLTTELAHTSKSTSLTTKLAHTSTSTEFVIVSLSTGSETSSATLTTFMTSVVMTPPKSSLLPVSLTVPVASTSAVTTAPSSSSSSSPLPDAECVGSHCKRPIKKAYIGIIVTASLLLPGVVIGLCIICYRRRKSTLAIHRSESGGSHSRSTRFFDVMNPNFHQAAMNQPVLNHQDDRRPSSIGFAETPRSDSIPYEHEADPPLRRDPSMRIVPLPTAATGVIPSRAASIVEANAFDSDSLTSKVSEHKGSLSVQPTVRTPSVEKENVPYQVSSSPELNRSDSSASEAKSIPVVIATEEPASTPFGAGSPTSSDDGFLKLPQSESRASTPHGSSATNGQGSDTSDSRSHQTPSESGDTISDPTEIVELPIKTVPISISNASSEHLYATPAASPQALPVLKLQLDDEIFEEEIFGGSLSNWMHETWPSLGETSEDGAGGRT